MAVNPVSGNLYVSNTESRNDLRFEGPGTFVPGVTLSGHLAESRVTVISGATVTPRYLNKHIVYSARPVPAGVAIAQLGYADEYGRDRRRSYDVRRGLRIIENRRVFHCSSRKRFVQPDQ